MKGGGVQEDLSRSWLIASEYLKSVDSCCQSAEQMWTPDWPSMTAAGSRLSTALPHRLVGTKRVCTRLVPCVVEHEIR